MSNTANKFSPEVRARAAPMVLGHDGGHALREWVSKAEVDSGKRGS